MKEIIIGILAGMITGTGMGGGTVLIILLTLLSNLNQLDAQMINLIFFIPTSISAIVINLKEKRIRFDVAKVIIMFGVIGSIMGAFIANNIDVKILKKIFGVFLLFIACYEINNLFNMYKKKKRENNSKYK